MDPYAQYRQQAASTASPAQLVLMLYDGALAEIVRAEVALAADDAAEAHDCLSRAQRIVLELTVTLDHERGGSMAGELARLYDFVSAQLVVANIGKDASALPSATRVLTELREAWDTACVRGAVPVAG